MDVKGIKPGEKFAKILSDKPGVIMAKVDETEIHGQTIVAAVYDGEKVCLMIGGEMSLEILVQLISAVEEVKESLVMNIAGDIFEGLFKNKS